jgi:hypothetical protein
MEGAGVPHLQPLSQLFEGETLEGLQELGVEACSALEIEKSVLERVEAENVHNLIYYYISITFPAKVQEGGQETKTWSF